MIDDLIGRANRIAIVISAIILAGAAIALVVIVWTASDAGIERIADFAEYLRRHDDRDARLIVTLGAAAIVVLTLTVLVLEFSPSPTQHMRVRELKSGDAAITTSQIAARIEHEVRGLPEVADTTATVARRGRRVEVVLDLYVHPGADLAQSADAACRAAQTVVEDRLSIELAARPRARLHYRELRLTMQTATPRAGWERPPRLVGEEDRERGTADAPEAT